MPQAPVVVPAAPVLSETDLTKLATEVATNRRELADVLTDFKLTEQQYTDVILKNTYFQQSLEALVKEWNGAHNTKNRVGFKAASIIEETLLILAKRVANPQEALSGVVETVKFLKSLTNLGDEEKTVGTGEKFVININLAGDIITKTVEAPGSAPSGASPLQIDAEGHRDNPPIRSIPQGTGTSPTIRSIPDGSGTPTPV